MKTAVSSPAPKPSNEQMLDAIAHMTLAELTILRKALAAMTRGKA